MLEYLQIAGELILKLSPPIYLAHWNNIFVISIDQMRVDRTRTEILYIVDIELKCLIDPS